ncbi:MAG: phenylalanyl-tRNA synthetase subunit beta, phenylalanyl-tRNA synthetase beta chain [Candidatus Paceibacter sp.]|jgi:phenylalanyl-tRNA synthetase beta chain|nr:phenylalanyl-tRNA synthetase subunit beta, phenylalanyl-tRNA synthetase beta chain [Candidatus Paceibacter sp.]
MKVLNAWLQNHIKEKIPDAEKLSHLFTFHAFEVEDVEKLGENFVLDVKILPDRAHYALSHQGIAREIAAITGLSLKQPEYQPVPGTLDLPSQSYGKASKKLNINVEEPQLCRRYIGRRIENIKVKASPDYFSLSLQAIGQRSINDIVDATNVVMFDIGQPLHVFDTDKVVGDITVRKAKAGEKITTLDTKEVTLEEWMLVIADEQGPLAIAGVKGGNRAAVTESTKNIIVESANFDPVAIRKTSTKVGIRNDSSKRFENELSPIEAENGMAQMSWVIKQLNPDAVFGDIIDVYPNPVQPWQVRVSPEYISKLLGVEVPESDMLEILRRMEIKVVKQGDELVLDIPYWRMDLKIPQDIAEEVGRIYGYEKIPAAVLPKPEKMPINKMFYWTEKIKDALIDLGFSEVYTYALTSEGEVEIQNPLASDKGFLRSSLRNGMEQALVFNSRNAPLLGLEEIKIFELGNVFTKNEQEEFHLAIGYVTTKSIKNKPKVSLEFVERIVGELGVRLGVELKGIIESNTDAGIVFEMDLTDTLEKFPDPHEVDIAMPQHAIMYKQISIYPFISRDIAVFVPEGISEAEVLKIITAESGDLLVKFSLFDIFHKQFPDGTKKTSYAFRLVFQSHERTLTDDEINPIMQRISDNMNSKEGWQVR